MEGTVETDIGLDGYFVQQCPGKKAQMDRACSMGTGRPDHDRADDIENTDGQRSFADGDA